MSSTTDMVAGVGLVAGIATLGFLLSRYKRCPPNQLLIVYGQTMAKGAAAGGHGTKSRVLHGGGAFVFPVLQDFAYLSLEPKALDIDMKGALSLEKIRVNVPSVFTVAIGTEPALMHRAAERLLGMDDEKVCHTAEEIIVGQLRQVIASMDIDEINRDRVKFVHEIEDKVTMELLKVGLALVNVNITNVTDDSGVLDAMGKKAEARIREQARIDVAERERHGKVGVANAEKEQDIAVAIAQKEREVMTRQALQEQAVRTAELEALEIQRTNESKALVAESNMTLKVAEAEFFREAETKRNEAEAQVVEAKAVAQARAALATAQRVEAEKRAEVEAPAKALKAETLVNAEAVAEEGLIKAKAEAEATFLRLDAEARGQYQILARKAEGLGMVVEQTGGSEPAFRLLMLEHLDTIAETTATAVSNIKVRGADVTRGGLQYGWGTRGVRAWRVYVLCAFWVWRNREYMAGPTPSSFAGDAAV